MINSDKIVWYLIIISMPQGFHMQLIPQVLFFFLAFLNLEAFGHQLHTERNLSPRLDLPSGNTMSFAFLCTALEIQDLWQQKKMSKKPS